MSGSEVFLKPRARQDLIEHYAYIAMDRREPAERFLQSAQRLFKDLADMPEIGRVWQPARPTRVHQRLQGIRVFGIPGFANYLVFYRVVEAGVEVLTVLHGARNVDQLLADLDE